MQNCIIYHELTENELTQQVMRLQDTLSYLGPPRTLKKSKKMPKTQNMRNKHSVDVNYDQKWCIFIKNDKD